MAPAAIPDTLPCQSGATFAREAQDAKDILSLEETEESWDKQQRAIARLHALYKGGGCYFEEDVVPAIKSLTRPIINAMNSERSRLSFEALEFVSSLTSLGRAFEPLLVLFLDALLRLCTRTSKVLVAKAQAAIIRLVEDTTLAGVLPQLREAVKDKSQSLRIAASAAALQALKSFTPRDLQAKITDVEDIIKSTARDANPAVRQVSRSMFEAYQILFASRVDSFTAPLSPTMKKYLAVKPKPIKVPDHASLAGPPVSAPSASAAFNAASTKGHARSASATEHGHADSSRPVEPPALRTHRSRAAMRVEMPPPQPREQLPSTTSHSFQPARSAPVGAQRTRTVSAACIKSAHAAVAAVVIPSAPVAPSHHRIGPQRVLAESQPSEDQHRPRSVLGPSRVQRPASALGTTSTDETVKPAVVYRAQRVLLPPPPPPAPEKPSKAESIPSKGKERAKQDMLPPRSNPPTRPPSAASTASRTKLVQSAKPVVKTAPTVPVNKSAVPPSKPAPKATTDAVKTLATSTSSKDVPAPTGFVPRRNNPGGLGGATGMTAAALSRAKELREARERASATATATKPGWGRAQIKKNTKVAAVLAKKAAKKPVEVPLPPSPGASPREVPIPETPDNVTRSPISDVPLEGIDEFVLDTNACANEKDTLAEKVSVTPVEVETVLPKANTHTERSPSPFDKQVVPTEASNKVVTIANLDSLVKDTNHAGKFAELIVQTDELLNFNTFPEDKENAHAPMPVLKLSELVPQVDELERMVLVQVQVDAQ